jgi:hypothetical protein
MNKKPFTEITTLNNKTIKIDVYTENEVTSETLTFTSKLSLTKYLDRLRKNLHKTDNT